MTQPAAQMAPIEIEIVAAREQFRRMHGEWDELAAVSGAPTWQTHAWISCWLDAFGADVVLLIACARSSGKLIAAAPMIVRSRRIKGVRLRILSFLENDLTPRSHFVVSDLRIEVIRELWKGLENYGGWDFAVLSNMPAEHPVNPLWRQFLTQSRLRYIEQPERQSPYIDMPDGYAGYREVMAYSMKRNITTSGNRLKKLGVLTVRRSPGDIEMHEALNIAYDVSARSWKAAHHNDLGGHPAQRKFYDAVVAEPELRKHLRIWILDLDHKPISFEMMIQSGNVLTGLATDYDQAYRHGSPGVYLRDQALQQCAELGVTCYDLAGQGYGYKLHWTKEILAHSQFWVFRKSLKSRILYFGKAKALPAWKRMTEKSRPVTDNADENRGDDQSAQLESTTKSAS